MLLRLPILLAIALLGLCACKEEGDSLSPPSSSQSSDGSGGSSGSGGSTGGDSTNDGSGSDGSSDGSDSGSGSSDGSGTGGSIGNQGDPMISDDELVGVSSVDSSDVTQSLITIVRTNGEIWEFEVPGISTTQIGSSITYRNINRVFGEVSGEFVFADGSTSQINTSHRIR